MTKDEFVQFSNEIKYQLLMKFPSAGFGANQMTEDEFNKFSNKIKYKLAHKFPSIPAFSAVASKLKTGKKKFTNLNIKQAVKDWVKDPVKALETYVDIADRDTREVTHMSFLFKDMKDFDEDISRWDVSNVQNINGMFFGAKVFNRDISSWNTANATNMYDMFWNADAFNKDYIKDWVNKPKK